MPTSKTFHRFWKDQKSLAWSMWFLAVPDGSITQQLGLHISCNRKPASHSSPQRRCFGAGKQETPHKSPEMGCIFSTLRTMVLLSSSVPAGEILPRFKAGSRPANMINSFCRQATFFFFFFACSRQVLLQLMQHDVSVPSNTYAQLIPIIPRWTTGSENPI